MHISELSASLNCYRDVAYVNKCGAGSTVAECRAALHAEKYFVKPTLGVHIKKSCPKLEASVRELIAVMS